MVTRRGVGIAGMFDPELRVTAELKMTRSDNEEVSLQVSGSQQSVLAAVSLLIESTRQAWKGS